METNSKEFDTIRLLQECDAGSKMAVSAIDEVLDRTQGSTLKNLLLDAKQHHAKLGNDIHTELRTVTAIPRSQVQSQKEWHGRKPI